MLAKKFLFSKPLLSLIQRKPFSFGFFVVFIRIIQFDVKFQVGGGHFAHGGQQIHRRNIVSAAGFDIVNF